MLSWLTRCHNSYAKSTRWASFVWSKLIAIRIPSFLIKIHSSRYIMLPDEEYVAS